MAVPSLTEKSRQMRSIFMEPVGIFCIPQNALGVLNKLQNEQKQIVIQFNFLHWKTINAQYSKL